MTHAIINITVVECLCICQNISFTIITDVHEKLTLYPDWLNRQKLDIIARETPIKHAKRGLEKVSSILEEENMDWESTETEKARDLSCRL